MAKIRAPSTPTDYEAATTIKVDPSMGAGAGDLSVQDSLETLTALGLELPSPAYFAGVVVFSLIGMVAYYYGKRRDRSRMRWVGLALMLYPYAVWQTWLLFVVGAGLSIAAWLDRP